MERTVQHKVEMLDKARDNVWPDKARMYQEQLNGIIELIIAMGYDVEYERSKATGWKTVCVIKA
jgi:hypothetical protein